MTNDKILELARRHLKLTWVNDDPEDLIAFARSLLEEERKDSGVDKQLNAYKTLVDSLEKQISFHARRRKQHEEAVATLESERECNARLTAELSEKAELIAAAEAVIEQWEPPLCPVIYRLLDVIERMKENA